MHAHYDRIGTYTFRHGHAYTSYVSRNLPLGSPLGSDVDEVAVGFSWIAPWSLLLEGQFKHQRIGEENLLERQYLPQADILGID